MTPEPGQGHPAFYAYADELHDRHRLKSGGYGTGSDPFANFTAIAAVSGRNRWDYPVERIIEKCTRIQSLSAQGRFEELREEFRDIGGLAGCCDAMLEDDHYADLPYAALREAQRHAESPQMAELKRHVDDVLAGRPPESATSRAGGEMVPDVARCAFERAIEDVRANGERLRERRWRESGGSGLTD